MCSKKVTSHTPEFPARADVIRSLIIRMKEERMVGSWAHLELVEERGWFSNLLGGIAPWIEVAMDEDIFQLNLGLGKDVSHPVVPWPEADKHLWKVPLSDSATLMDWIDSCFKKAFDLSADRKLAGWIES
jgi:hypothetical protein